jgi:hypothetical protein
MVGLLYIIYRAWRSFTQPLGGMDCSDPPHMRMALLCGKRHFIPTKERHDTAARARVRSRQEYHYTEDVDQLPDGWVSANAVCFLGEVVHRRSIGTPIATTMLETSTFWEFLKSLGGEGMWDYIQEGETDVSWVSAALTAGTFIGVTHRSYDRVRAGTVSGAGWIICYTTTKKLLRGSFYETSSKAGWYRGELLGLVALHTMIVAVAKHYQLLTVVGKICCDNQPWDKWVKLAKE